MEIFEEKNVGDFDHLLGQKIEKTLVVITEPQKKGHRTKLTLKFEDSDSRAIMWAPNFPEYFYGDQLKISGYLKKPRNFKSPESDREFDYVSFLKKNKIFYKIKPIEIEYLQSGQGGEIKEHLFKVKSSFLGQIKKLIPGSEASLLGGVMLGAREDMGRELLDDFRRTGVIHIVVLSGYNLTLVAEFFVRIFAFLGIVYSSILASVAIVLFAIMTGASATIVRATIMALIVIVARATGRTSEAIRALFLAGLLMLLFNPMLLVYDPSFQLSFLATLGLLVLSPKIEKMIPFVPKGIFDFRRILAATLATQIFVFPLLMYMMGEISVISPVVNVLVLIFVPFIMFFGLIFVLVSYFSFFLASLIAFGVYLMLAYVLILVDFFSKLPIAVMQAKEFSFGYMIAVYVFYLLIFFVWKKFKKSKLKGLK